MITPNYPLQWPVTWPRTKSPTWSRFGSGGQRPSIAKASDFIQDEIRKLGGKDLVISTNLKYKSDGFPYSGQKEPLDKGAAVYFKYKGESMVLACDTFDKIGCNIYAIGKTIEAMRSIERYGCSELLNKAFTGFKALPSGQEKTPWFVMLGVTEESSIEDIKKVYIQLAKKYHPDLNPTDVEKMKFINEAYQEALTIKTEK